MTPRPIYLDPKADIVFKRIFGEHQRILKSFLNALLPLAEDAQIVSLDYLSPEQVPEIPEFKNTIVDVRCKDAKGRRFIVEMQMAWTDSFTQRMLFNSAKAIVSQLVPGQSYVELQPVYAIAILDAEFDEGRSYYHHYRIISERSSQRVLKGLEMIFVELPKFKTKKLASVKDAWLWFLKELRTHSTVPALLMQTPAIVEAMKLAQQGAYTAAQLDHYDRYWDSVSRERTLVLEARAEGKAEGKAEGRAEGKAEGRAEGEVDGLAKGKAEALALLMASGMAEAKARHLLKL